MASPEGFPVESPDEARAAWARRLEILRSEQEAGEGDPEGLAREIAQAERSLGTTVSAPPAPRAPAPARPSAPVKAVNWADFEPVSGPKMAAPGAIDWSQFTPLKNEPPRNIASEVGAQLSAGAVVDLPKMIGQAMQWLSEPDQDLYESGKGLAESAQAREEENPFLKPQLEGRGIIGSALSRGARALMPSLASAVPAIAAAPLGAPAAIGAGAIGASVLFGGSQAQETYENVLKAGGTEEEAKQAGYINGLIEAGGETIGTIAGFKLFGLGAKALGGKTLSPVQAAIMGNTETAVWAPFLKQLPKTAAVEAGTEFGQNYGEALTEEIYGVEGKQPVTEGMEGASAALGMTALLAPFGLGGFALRARRNERIGNALSDKDADPVLRLAAAKVIYQDIADVNEEAAQVWARNSAIAVAAKAPIVVNESFAKPDAIGGILNAASVDEAIGAAAAAAAETTVAPPAPDLGAQTRARVAAMSIPGEANATREQGAAALDVRNAPGDGEALGGGNAEHEEPAGAGGTATEVTGHPQSGNEAVASVDEGAHQAAASPLNEHPEPSKEQILAGNAKLGHAEITGMDVSFENPVGSVREDKHNSPPKWRVEMKDHYGYIRGTVAFDSTAKKKQGLDAFVKPGTSSSFDGTVYVVNQGTPEGAFDEHKALIGYASQAEARAAYLRSYDDHARAVKAIRSIVALPMQQFKDWAFSRIAGPSKGELILPAKYWLDAKDVVHGISAAKPAPKGAVTFTDFEQAREARRSRLKTAAADKKRIDTERDSIVEAAIKLGGISMAERGDITGDDKAQKTIMGVGHIFTKAGDGSDSMATRLGQYGYLTRAELEDVDGGVQALKDKIREELSGRKRHLSIARSERAMQADEEAKARDLAEQQAEHEQALTDEEEAQAAQAANAAAAELAERWANMTEEERDAALDEIYGPESGHPAPASQGTKARPGAREAEARPAGEAATREPGQDDEEVGGVKASRGGAGERGALFIPLKTEHFEAFERGTKTTEYRKYGGPWTEKNVYPGRKVVLSKGYGKGSRLNGVVVEATRGAPPSDPAWKAIYGDAQDAFHIKISVDRGEFDQAGAAERVQAKRAARVTAQENEPTPIDPNGPIPDPSNTKPISASPEETLVCLACSETKRFEDKQTATGTPHTVPLHELYDGPLWQTTRRYIGSIDWGQVLVLSGKHRWTSAASYGRPYDERMSREKVDELIRLGLTGQRVTPIKHTRGGTFPHSSVASMLQSPTEYGKRPFKNVIIVGGELYRRAFHAVVTQMVETGLVAPDAAIRTAEGGIGEQRAQLGQFLAEVNGRRPVAWPFMTDKQRAEAEARTVAAAKAGLGPEEAHAAVRDRNEAVLTAPEGTAPPAQAKPQPVQQSGLFTPEEAPAPKKEPKAKPENPDQGKLFQPGGKYQASRGGEAAEIDHAAAQEAIAWEKSSVMDYWAADINGHRALIVARPEDAPDTVPPFRVVVSGSSVHLKNRGAAQTIEEAKKIAYSGAFRRLPPEASAGEHRPERRGHKLNPEMLRRADEHRQALERGLTKVGRKRAAAAPETDEGTPRKPLRYEGAWDEGVAEPPIGRPKWGHAGKGAPFIGFIDDEPVATVRYVAVNHYTLEIPGYTFRDGQKLKKIQNTTAGRDIAERVFAPEEPKASRGGDEQFLAMHIAALDNIIPRYEAMGKAAAEQTALMKAIRVDYRRLLADPKAVVYAPARALDEDWLQALERNELLYKQGAILESPFDLDPGNRWPERWLNQMREQHGANWEAEVNKVLAEIDRERAERPRASTARDAEGMQEAIRSRHVTDDIRRAMGRFKQEGPRESRARRGAGASAGLARGELTSAIEGAFGPGARALFDTGLFRYAADEGALPENLRAYFQRGTEALYDPAGAIWFIGSELAGERVVPVVLHELGEHYGLKEMLGDKGYARLQLALRASRSDPAVEKAWRYVERRYPELKAGGEDFVSEVLARLGESPAALKLPFFQKLIAAVREFLIRLGLKAALVERITDGDIVLLVTASARRAIAGAQARAYNGRGEVSEDTRDDRHGEEAPDERDVLAPEAIPGRARGAAAPVFYSELEQKVQGLRRASGTAEEWTAAIRNLGLKRDEIEWSGVNDWLVARGVISPKIDKREVLDFLKSDGVKVEEVVLGENAQGFSTDEMRDLIRDRDDIQVALDAQGWNLVFAGDGKFIGVQNRASDTLFLAPGVEHDDLEPEETMHGDVLPFDNLPRRSTIFTHDRGTLNVREAVQRIAEIAPAVRDMPDAESASGTKFESWRLPGGEGYRELLLTLPTADSFAQKRLVEAENAVIAQAERESMSHRGARDYALDVARGELSDEQRSAMSAEMRPLADELRAADLERGRLRGNPFQSAHFDEPNILAHVRFDERFDAQGKRVLFVEEVQSDWAEKGRREGFREPARIQAAEAVSEQAYQRLHAARLEAVDAARRNDNLGFNTPVEALTAVRTHEDWESRWEITGEADRAALRAYYDAYRERNERARQVVQIRNGVPMAPFVGKTDAWVSLAMKRIIRWAADHDFDRIAWTTGAQQNQRYSLEKRIGALRAWRNNGLYSIEADRVGMPGGDNAVVRNGMEEKELVHTVGKELADKIIARIDENEKVGPERVKLRYVTLAGIDLKIGGEGMATFYDKIVPNVVNDVLKKFGGGRVTAFRMNTGETVKPGSAVAQAATVEQPGFELTPELKERALAGLPMFARGREPSSHAMRTRGMASPQRPISSTSRPDHLREDRNYDAAKAGDMKAAMRLVREFVRPEDLQDARARFGGDVIYVPVVAEEAGGDNALPHALAAHYAKAAGGRVEYRIVQANRAYHTDAGAMERMIARPLFDGPVKSGARYVIVDDVTTLGSTLAELANHIRSAGGKVAGAVVLADASRTARMMPTRGQINEIDRRYGQILRDEFGVEPAALTAAEAGYVLSFRNAESLRARAAAARSEREARLGQRAPSPGRVKAARGGAAENPQGDFFGSDKGPVDPFTLKGQAKLADRVKARLDAMLSSERHFNWWHRSVGTQLHKALTHRVGEGQPGGKGSFGAVFWEGQAQITDTNRFSMQAEEKAPDILLRLEGPGQLFRRPPAKADLEGAGKALFGGTLFGGPSPLSGKVFADDELRRFYGLTDKQISLYRQTRAAVDDSVETMAKSVIARLVRGYGIKVDPDMTLADVAANATDELKARLEDLRLKLQQIGEEVLPEEEIEAPTESLLGIEIGKSKAAKRLSQRAQAQQEFEATEQALQKVGEIRERASQLQKAGYMPLMRFGQHYVTVTKADETGAKQVLYHGMYETESEANLAKKALAGEFPEAQIVSGLLSKDAWRIFKGISPETIELFADIAGLDEHPLMQKFIQLAASERSALKRLLERKGTPGWSWDVPRSLAQFITSNARTASGNYHHANMLRAIEDVPQGQGDVKDEAVRLYQYLVDPQEEAQKLRGYLFFHFLGGSVAAMLVNMTQPVLVSAPFLNQYAGVGKVAKELARAMGEAAQGIVPQDAAGQAMHRAIEDGIVAPHEIYQLMAEARGGIGRSIALRQLTRIWGGLFSLAEAWNRRSTFLAAYRIAEANGEKDPYAFAVRAVHETQFIYNKGNRPDWARGAIGATLFTFKQFTISYLEFLKRLPLPQRGLALGILALAAGVQGLPGSDDLDDILDTIGQWLGYATNSKQWKRKTLSRLIGKEAAMYVLHGVSSIPGMPLDIQMRLGLGNLVPGTSLFKPSDLGDKSREIAEVLGPAGGLAKAGVDVARAAFQGDTAEAMKSGLPVALKNAYQAAEMFSTGQYRDTRGRRVVDVNAMDAMAKLIGFNPRVVAEDSRRTGEAMQNVNLQREVESAIAEQWARGIADKHPDDIRAAAKKLQDWNRTNPELPVRIDMNQIRNRVKAMRQSREQRIVKGAAPEIRRNVREDLRP